MLPEPTLSFTIPSLHDGLPLDCRVYHPPSLAATNLKAPPWKRHGAIVAHPYAPMGGSYDDSVVESVAKRLLAEGYLVGTFNFRGAGHSAGRTSWTAKPERDDYASMVGFMVYYAHIINPFEKQQQPAAAAEEEEEPPALILGGYSYGAMVTAQLAPMEALLQPFASPEPDSPAAQIRLRAQHLAEQQNLILGSVRAAMQARLPQSPTKQRGVRVGGSEGGGGGAAAGAASSSSRRSHDSLRFSLDGEDKFRRGVHEFLARKAKHGPRRRASGAPVPGGTEDADAATGCGDAPAKLAAADVVPPPRPAYLLVSPLQGVVTHLATMSWTRRKDDDAEDKLVRHPTVAIYGDADVFVPAGKLRAWAARLSGGASLFAAREVRGAGHFWKEEGVLQEMVDEVGRFCSRHRGGLI
ncbi:hypothetical protein UVI_02030010 [Ustilaginoidea virens]|nr:hypothetical protein UVI_02030010 [Ustilaginoidea virens]